MGDLLLQQWTVTVLVCLVLVFYGTLHGWFVMYVWREHEDMFVPLVLATSPFGVLVPILGFVLIVGTSAVSGGESAIAIVALEGVAFVPVALQVIRGLLVR